MCSSDLPTHPPTTHTHSLHTDTGCKCHPVSWGLGGFPDVEFLPKVLQGKPKEMRDGDREKAREEREDKEKNSFGLFWFR